jgi:hypothetical protein
LWLREARRHEMSREVIIRGEAKASWRRFVGRRVEVSRRSEGTSQGEARACGEAKARGVAR